MDISQNRSGRKRINCILFSFRVKNSLYYERGAIMKSRSIREPLRCGLEKLLLFIFVIYYIFLKLKGVRNGKRRSTGNGL